MPIDRSKIKWDDEPIDAAKIEWGGGKAEPDFAQSFVDYFSKPVAPAPANLQAQGYDPLAEKFGMKNLDYIDRTLGNIPQDVMEISQGFTPESMGALGSALYNQPLNTMAAIGSGMAQGIGGFLADPAGTFERRPISTLMGLQGAHVARMPAYAAIGKAAEVAYPRVRRALDPMNRMLADVYNKPEIQAALQTAPEGMPVSQALADVNAPVAQAVTREAAKYAPEQTRAAQLAQEQARLEQISKIARTPEELAAAEEARGAAATENYRNAFKQVAPDLPEEFLNKPSMKAAFKEADNIAAERGGEATPVEQMHNIKLALDKIVSKPEDYGLGGAQKSAIAKTREEFIDRLKTVPEYARARAEFASQSVPISQMQVAQELKNILLDPTTEAATRGGMFTRAMKDVPKVAKRATGQSYYENLSDLFSPEQVEVFEGIADDFRRNKLADEQAALGAATAPEAKELASANVTSFMNIPFLNRNWTLANTIVKRSLGQIDEKLAVKLALLVQDPKELSRAIAKAKRWEKETAGKVESIKERGRSITKMTPINAVTRPVSLVGSVQNAFAPQVNQNAMAR